MTGVLYELGLPPTLIPQFGQNAEPSLTAVPQLGQYFILIPPRPSISAINPDACGGFDAAHRAQSTKYEC